jgi:DNA-binding Xre family transcriptional regulator
MFEFNLDQFLLDKRLGVYELSEQTGISFQTLYSVKSRGTARIRFIRQLENIYGDLSLYIGKAIKKEKNELINSEQ